MIFFFEFLDELKKELLDAVKKSKVYFLSLVGTNAGEFMGKGIPRSSFYWYDIKTGMELKDHGINFLSAQDLKNFHEHQEKKNGSSDGSSKQLNIYELVQYFMKYNQDGYYFLDEVPLIKTGMNS